LQRAYDGSEALDGNKAASVGGLFLPHIDKPDADLDIGGGVDPVSRWMVSADHEAVARLP
jgi:hypothetical protein